MTDSDNSKDTVNSSAIPADDAPEDEHDTSMADELAGLAEEVRRLERQTSGEITAVHPAREKGGTHEIAIDVPDGRGYDIDEDPDGLTEPEVMPDGGTQELASEMDRLNGYDEKLDELVAGLREAFGAGYARAIEDFGADADPEKMAESDYVESCHYHYWYGRSYPLEGWLQAQFNLDRERDTVFAECHPRDDSGTVDARGHAEQFEQWHANNTEPDAPEVRDTLLRVVRQLASAHRDGVPAGDVLDLTVAKTGASVRTVASVQAECIAAGELVETDTGCLKFVRGDGA